ncbi:unnamed protein product [Hymenolepis diminuta]|uniref:Uncharacterized protein n=1 Tax=Hymenolepis diminuta TaxID=6216 RepID=A0A3P6ZPG9_HYMDI|nr:unnamed protein product [Hymenolepis diminuta]
MPKESLAHIVFMLKNVAARLVVLTPFDNNPENLLGCFLDGSPPGPFRANQLTVASSEIQERIRKFIQEYKRQYKCFPITGSLPCWRSDGTSLEKAGRRKSL